jgi:hypothetical protein
MAWGDDGLHKRGDRWYISYRDAKGRPREKSTGRTDYRAAVQARCNATVGPHDASVERCFKGCYFGYRRRLQTKAGGWYAKYGPPKGYGSRRLVCGCRELQGLGHRVP